MSFSVTSPVKLFASDFKKCVRSDNNLWYIPLQCQRLGQEIRINFESVWLQGQVINAEDDEFIMNDGTGEVLIKSIASSEGDLSWLVKGAVCTVVGALLAAAPCAVVEPSKAASLPVAGGWAVEVAEAKRTLCDPPPQAAGWLQPASVRSGCL